MKKFIQIILVIGISCFAFWLGFGQEQKREPNSYYNVFLDGELIGTINSKSKLEKYINVQNEFIKNKYKVDTVYSPNGLEIEKTISYTNEINTIEEVYNKIKEKKAFTIKGYQLTVKESNDQQVIYAVEKSIFENSLRKTIEIFVGAENYLNYVNDKQSEIKETGKKLENVYIENDKTIRETYISTDEIIYTDADDLSQYLIFGKDMKKREYIVKVGDTISAIAFNNKISIEEFLLSNPDIKSSKSLLFAGQTVQIAETSPQIKIVVDEYVVEDVEVTYQTIEQYDNTLAIGNNRVVQEGSNGTDRISKTVTKVNGTITNVNTESKVEMKPTVNKVVLIGQKYIPTVGSLASWGWPTDGGWTISSYYGYRINPISGARELHNGIDIAGTGYGSNIYATNNGVVTTASYNYVNGNYVIINHNNGYYTYYGHMSQMTVQEGQTVARGEVIGYVGTSGWATGPHLHYTIYIGVPYRGGYEIDPLTVYR